jgi:peptidoglycan/LPS O-acetylase OafA/YrhL
MDDNRSTSQVVKKEISSLTTIRGIAALWVVIFHLWTALLKLMPEASFLSPLIASGHFAVPLFFILSGYVLSLQYLKKLSLLTIKVVLRFWLLRLGRVYPVHCCTLFIYLVIFARRGWPTEAGLSIEKFISNIFLTHAWDYSFSVSWNYPSWSISSEWFAYLLFPLLAVPLSRIGRRSATLLLVLACGLSAYVFAFEQNLVFRGLAVVLPTVVGGIALAILYPPETSKANQPLWAEICLLAILALPFAIGKSPIQSAIYIVLFFTLVAILGSNGHFSTAFWRSPPLIYLGEISYSLYMTHAISITLITRFFPFATLQAKPFFFRSGFLLVCLVVILGIAIGVYYAAERPLRILSRRLVKLGVN